MAKVGILGATGMVGNELLKVLIDRKFPIEYLGLYASEKSADKKRIKFQDGKIIIEELRKKEKNKSNSLKVLWKESELFYLIRAIA